MLSQHLAEASSGAGVSGWAMGAHEGTGFVDGFVSSLFMILVTEVCTWDRPHTRTSILPVAEDGRAVSGACLPKPSGRAADRWSSSDLGSSSDTAICVQTKGACWLVHAEFRLVGPVPPPWSRAGDAKGDTPHSLLLPLLSPARCLLWRSLPEEGVPSLAASAPALPPGLQIGDETFIIAALMAMRHSRSLVLAGALSALAIMTVRTARHALLSALAGAPTTLELP